MVRVTKKVIFNERYFKLMRYLAIFYCIFSFIYSVYSEPLKLWIPFKSDENISFVKSWGKKGAGDNDFMFPRGITTDLTGNVYVVDTGNHCIKKFSSEGIFIAKYSGIIGPGKIYKFVDPIDIAIDTLNNIYITDVGASAVYKLDYDFNFIKKWGNRGSLSNEKWAPMSISIDGMNNIYIADFYNNYVQKFSNDGKLTGGWGKWEEKGSDEGEFEHPQGITVGKRTRVYVADTFNHRIQRFTTKGNFLCEWGSMGRGREQFITPKGLVVDGDGRVYVVDAGNHRISVFTADGDYLLSWGKKGSENSEFQYPQDIAIDINGNIYVSDTENHRIQKFKGIAPKVEVARMRNIVKITNLAIADFSGKNISIVDASIISDFLRTELVNIGDFNVIEKNNMDKLLAEAAFQKTGCTTTACAVQMGKILNVNQIVVGSFSRFDNKYYINVSLVDVETGKILKSVDEKLMSVAEVRDICKIIAYKIID
ncbi:MAG: 6-bladed beta-propeller [Elusimicrobia bacterium]|nr:6-bladed beta-propeller [Elusimicrobiota bacterium]